MLVSARTSIDLRRWNGGTQTVSTRGWCGYAERRKGLCVALARTLLANTFFMVLGTSTSTFVDTANFR